MLYGRLIPKNLVVMMVLTPALLVTALMKMTNHRVSPDIVATSTRTLRKVKHAPMCHRRQQ